MTQSVVCLNCLKRRKVTEQVFNLHEEKRKLKVNLDDLDAECCDNQDLRWLVDDKVTELFERRERTITTEELRELTEKNLE